MAIVLFGCAPGPAHRVVTGETGDAAEPADAPSMAPPDAPAFEAARQDAAASEAPSLDAAVAQAPDAAVDRAVPPVDAPPDASAPDVFRGPGGLPVVVTSYFPNQGWFGDPVISADFRRGSTLITQLDSVDGPCAARDPAAQGRCLRIVYTPPPELTAPTGFVGVFFLTTLALDYPEAMPPAARGEANWGIEPPLAMPSGATRISFLAASEGALAVVFKAGTDRDSFLVPDTATPLTAAWTSHELSLTGAQYPAGVYGAFAWVLLDTSKPATFYLDSILWQ